MSLSKTISLCACIVIGGYSSTSSETFDLPGGLLFGSTLSEVQLIAQAKGWDVEKSTAVPYGWTNKATGLTLYFCDQAINSVDQSLDGKLGSFVETVWKLELKYGEPDTSVFILSPSSSFESRGIQSVFNTAQGVKISVQVYTKDDKATLWKRTSDGSVCEQE